MYEACLIAVVGVFSCGSGGISAASADACIGPGLTVLFLSSIAFQVMHLRVFVDAQFYCR